MIKVEHTKTHTFKSWNELPLGKNKDFHPLVTDAKLVLVRKPMTLTHVGYERLLINILTDKIILYSQWSKELGLKFDIYEPILISETEKIEHGDKIYNSHKQTIETAGLDIAMDICNPEHGFYKVLALPEHFSPEQLQMIVDGKLKDGDGVLVECVENVWYNSRPNPNGTDCRDIYDVLVKEMYVKLNPYTTIYLVEEKMVPASKFEELLNLAITYSQKDPKMSMSGPKEFEERFKKRFLSYKEWFEQNVK